MRYEAFRNRLIAAVLHTPGDTPEAVRRAAFEHAGGTRDGVPPALTHYVDTVAGHAYRVTDADVAALQAAGFSDDSIFEITVATAVGAALHRLDRGMAALRGEEPD
jgi:alkylhydroperoxidase family enzyme